MPIAFRGSLASSQISIYNINGHREDPIDAVYVSVYPYGFPPGASYVSSGDALIHREEAYRLNTGIYKYDFLLPADAEIGTWYVLWEAELRDGTFISVEEIKVKANPEDQVYTKLTGLPALSLNTIYTLTLSKIKALDLEEFASYESFFTSQYCPLYASYADIMSLIGSVIDSVAVDTVNYLIWQASREADIVTFAGCSSLSGDCSPGLKTSGRKVDQYLSLARRKYVQLLTSINLLRDLNSPGMTSKQLGHLKVAYNSSFVKDLLKDLMKELKEWEHVLNNGGCLATGASIGMRIGYIGVRNPSRPRMGRQVNYDGSIGSNRRTRESIYHRHKHNYRPHYSPLPKGQGTPMTLFYNIEHE